MVYIISLQVEALWMAKDGADGRSQHIERRQSPQVITCFVVMLSCSLAFLASYILAARQVSRVYLMTGKWGFFGMGTVCFAGMASASGLRPQH